MMATQVLHHQQLSLCKHPHIVEFKEVFLTPRYLGTAAWHLECVVKSAEGGTPPCDILPYRCLQAL